MLATFNLEYKNEIIFINLFNQHTYRHAKKDVLVERPQAWGWSWSLFELEIEKLFIPAVENKLIQVS